MGSPSHRWGSIGVTEREVSALNLFQTPRPASPKVIFQNAKLIQNIYNGFWSQKQPKVVIEQQVGVSSIRIHFAQSSPGSLTP